jgi:serine/threonine protein kinase
MGSPSLVADRFQIGEPVASGGMGTVYRAIDRERGQPVAVKLQTVDGPEDAARFDREAAALAMLDHPGIVRYVAHGTTTGSERFLAMEWIEGESLAATLAEDDITIADAVAIARQVAGALAEAHRHDLLHRDIKPENLMLEAGVIDRVRVVDFGLARRIVEDHKLTATGFALGTPGYMAPEQTRGVRALDGRVDIFALGCVLYECLAGFAPFAGENPLAIQIKVLLTEPPPLGEVAEIPDALARIVGKMMAKEPDARPASMREVEAALVALGALPEVHRERGDRATTRRTWRMSAECLVVAAVRRPDPKWLERARGVAARWPGTEVLRDGALVVRHREALAAARCAIELAAALPEATFVVTTPAAPDLEDVIDRSTRVMSVAAVRAIFARGANSGRVHLDAPSATLLRAHFDIDDDGDLQVLGRARG